MSAPSLLGGNAGQITATSGTTAAVAMNVGEVFMLFVLQDGTGANMTLTDTNGSAEDLGGTDNTLTAFPGNPYTVGNPAAAKMFAWIGRAISASVTCDVASSAGDDLYYQEFRYANVSAGTTFATVIENGSAGTVNSDAGTGVTISDVGVTTLGVDRLALNLIGINDDATGLTGASTYSGETGGTWDPSTFFESATGTDGTVLSQSAAMASAGTINGGTLTITSDGWGVIGFALIGNTVVATTETRKTWPALQAVNRAGTY